MSSSIVSLQYRFPKYSFSFPKKSQTWDVNPSITCIVLFLELSAGHRTVRLYSVLEAWKTLFAISDSHEGCSVLFAYSKRFRISHHICFELDLIFASTMPTKRLSCFQVTKQILTLRILTFLTGEHQCDITGIIRMGAKASCEFSAFQALWHWSWVEWGGIFRTAF